MKKSLLFISMLVAGATSSIAQTIPNPGFETWTSGEPDGWGTSNALVAGGVTQTTSKKSGVAAIKIQTNAGQAGIAVSSGTITTTGVTGGFPFSSRVVDLSGFLRYVPTGGDTALISVILTKWNGSSRDTIGTSLDTLTVGWATTLYNPFTTIIKYTAVGNPDSAQIILRSSIGTGVAGSVLLVDDLSFTLPPPPICNPDPNIPTTGTQPTILPVVTDTIIKTPGATFDQTFTIYVPSNFDFQPAGAPLSVQGVMDSVHIDGVTGIPPTFTVTCGTPNCMVYGGQVACFKVVGPMPNVDDTLYQFDITISPYGVITGPAPILTLLPSTKIEDNVSNQALASYAVKVGNPPPPVIIGIESFDVNGFNVSQNSPNPFDASTVINFTCPISGKVGFVVTDVLGRQVYDTSINATAGANTFTFSTDLASGTYFFSISDGTNTITRKMVITE